ncbi:MAG: metal-dependent hydrolase [Rickettsiales bacterium]|nr:metal-dependent hydrolase [Rickettsiales bacterium]|tara:strand:+ start:2080 stop:3087 length:1008 start_codon:yes stop_codon:yes gene_type:complete
MDPVSQGLLGAVFSCSFAKKKEIRFASFCGLIGGVAPDIDILIRSNSNPLLFIEYHRHFSHSLAFVPVGGLIISFFLYLFFKQKKKFKTIFIFTTLGFLSHGFLDSCTSYGTSLFWPFSESRISWNIISIIDPIYTFILLFFFILSFFLQSGHFTKLGLCLSFLYLGFGLSKHIQVEKLISKIAEDRGHKVERHLLKPTIGNVILWRSVYQYNKYYYVDAVYMPTFGIPKIRKGKKVKVIDKETVFPEILSDSLQRDDIRKFSFFSQDFIYIHPDFKNIIADLRYGTLPDDDMSLWGIEINPSENNKHVTFKKLRNFKNEHYQIFWKMLRGDLTQ